VEAVWAAVAGAAMFAAGGIASAQSVFPAKPVHILVPYAAGGGVDILARTLGDVVSRQWGQTVVVENRPRPRAGWWPLRRSSRLRPTAPP